MFEFIDTASFVFLSFFLYVKDIASDVLQAQGERSGKRGRSAKIHRRVRRTGLYRTTKTTLINQNKKKKTTKFFYNVTAISAYFTNGSN